MAKELINNKKTVNDLVVNVNGVSRIAEGVVLVGDLSSQNDVRLDGIVEGTVFSRGRVVVGESAKIKGALVCANTDFWGEMDGDIHVSNLLVLKSTAKVKGSLNVNKLQVEIGAGIDGSCKMITEQEFEKSLPSLIKTKLPAMNDVKTSGKQD